MQYVIDSIGIWTLHQDSEGVALFNFIPYKIQDLVGVVHEILIIKYFDLVEFQLKPTRAWRKSKFTKNWCTMCCWWYLRLLWTVFPSLWGQWNYTYSNDNYTLPLGRNELFIQCSRLPDTRIEIIIVHVALGGCLETKEILIAQLIGNCRILLQT